MDLFDIAANKAAAEKTHYDKLVSTVDWIWTDEDYSVDMPIGSDENVIMGYHHFDWVIDGLIIPKKTGTVTITATLRGWQISYSPKNLI